MSVDGRAQGISETQRGVITLDQLRGVGMTERQVIVRRRSGVLVSMHESVYRFAAAAPSFEQSLVAACLATGVLTVASHRAGALVWGVRGIRTAPVEVTSLRGGVPRLRGVLLHTTDELGPADIAERNGIPVTSPARTLIDLGAVAPWLVEPAFEDAILTGLVTYPYMWRTVKRLAVRGRRGIGCMREVLEVRDPSAAPTESALEDKFVKLCRRYRFTGFARQCRIGPLRVDFGDDAARILAELDGRRWHAGLADQRRDRRRDNELSTKGYIVLRFTWNDLRYWPDTVVADIRAAYAARNAA